MSKLDEITHRFKNVAWLQNCGAYLDESILEFSVRQLDSWRDVVESMLYSDWEDVTTEARGDLTGYLTVKHPSRYQGKWNSLVSEARQIIEREVMPVISNAQHKLAPSSELLDIIKWDLTSIAMTLYYADCNPPRFFLDLLAIYELGHLPCGWEGEWPNGTILYY